MAAFDFSSSFAGINNSLARLGQQNDARWLREAQADVGRSLQSGDYAAASRKAFEYGDSSTGLGLLKLGEAAKDRALASSTLQSWGSDSSAATAPAANPSPYAIGNPTEIENGFIDTVRKAGLNNPIGLAAVAATGRAESGFSPANANRSWNDPSESGQAGQAGGIMSWRGPRLQQLYSFAAQRGEQPGSISPQTQAMFFAQEDPTLIPRLQAAKSPQEANTIMAQAWRYAGYDRPGGENARRLALTHRYAGRYGQPVQVAENEADVQRLETQMAQNQPADLPATDAPPAQGFAVPGGGAEASVSADRNVQLWQQRYTQAAASGNERLMKVAEMRLGMATKDAERRYAEGKTPESVREWHWAKQNGLTDAKSPIAYARERAEATRQDTAPVTRQIKQPDQSEVVVQWNPDTRRWDPLEAPAGGEAVRPKGVKLTEQQSKDLIYYNRGLQALEAFEPNAEAYASGGERIASNVPGGNYVVSEKFQQAKQAGENFLTSILRKDTGAAITKEEQEIYGRVFLPQPGDKPAVLTQKAEARKQAIDALRSGLGPAEVLALGQRLTTRQPGESASQKPDQGGWQDLGGGIRIREKR